jgi:uncharacterized membrane protein YqgA involved in biofilm formation
MKRLTEIIKLNFLPLVLCIGIIIAFETPGRPITVSDILIGVIVGYYSGVAMFRFKSKS